MILYTIRNEIDVYAMLARSSLRMAIDLFITAASDTGSSLDYD